MKAGFFGAGRAESLLSIVTTKDMVGLSTGSSCTHNSPTWMHLNISLLEFELRKEGSINSVDLSSFQTVHACIYCIEI